VRKERRRPARRERAYASPFSDASDDAVQIRRFLRAGFELQDFAVQEAATGAEGIRAATLKPVDLVIVDLELPDKDGAEIVERLRAWSKVPIIVLSARSRRLGEETICGASAPVVKLPDQPLARSKLGR
jgi:CheY-like chemotaxis protein